MAIKNLLRDIAHHVEFLRELKVSDGDRKYALMKKMQDELVCMNTLLEGLLEKLEEMITGEEQHTLTVRPAETNGKEALFVVSGDELASLLEACSGATLRMKKKEADKK